MKPILEIQNISKKFKIQHESQPYLSLRDSFDNLFSKKNVANEEFWALQEVSFNVYPGESIGIIGRNGAGKSTLLKILSKITPPTSGKIISRGRIASLLEVGTGFHSELTGRENIYLNGSILGLKRLEINQQFDAIVDFSGVEKFLDTPLKHYSSGMQLRLAFAVAAHLEPEVLIIDEVLAVGDADFQRKCIGKMDEVSKSGRTVLFVSHNIPVMKQLCERTVLLQNGKLELDGITKDVLNYYISQNSSSNAKGEIILNQNTQKNIFFSSVSSRNNLEEIVEVIRHDEDFFIQTSFTANEDYDNVEISLCFKNANGVAVLFTSLTDVKTEKNIFLKKGKYKTKTKIRGNFFLPDLYTIDIYIHERNKRNLDSLAEVIKFEIIETGSYMAPYGRAANDFCCVLEECDWEFKQII